MCVLRYMLLLIQIYLRVSESRCSYLYSYELVKDPINGHHCNFEDKQKSSYIQISICILQSAYRSELNFSCHNYDYIIFWTNMVGILRNIWIFCIEIKHKSRCGTKIFYYTCNLLQVLFMIFLLKSFTSNVFFEILYWYCKPFCFEHFKNGGSCPSMIIVSSPYRTLFAQCDEINL